MIKIRITYEKSNDGVLDLNQITNVLSSHFNVKEISDPYDLRRDKEHANIYLKLEVDK